MRMKMGPSALILEPWSLRRRRPPPVENWSPFVGARADELQVAKPLSITLMRRRNKRLNSLATALLAVTPKDHILEIGYGSGETLARVARMARSGFVAGIDRSMEMLQAGWKTSKKAKLNNVSVLRGDVSWLPWSACSFDKAFCVDGITEWPCTRSGLEEAFRVLRPGGVLIIAEHITSKFSRAKALALAHVLDVVGFQDMEVQLVPEGRSELLILRAVRS